MGEQGAMAVTGTRKAEHGVRADYLRGDPSQEGPITRGMLALEAQELRFSVPDGPELKIDLRDMEGLTVSGRSPYEHPRRRVRGTMFVAARSNGSVDVWEFAVERKAGAELRDRIHRELHARRLRRPLFPSSSSSSARSRSSTRLTRRRTVTPPGATTASPCFDPASCLSSWRSSP